MGTFMQQSASIGMTVLTVMSLAHAAFAPRQVAQETQQQKRQEAREARQETREARREKIGNAYLAAWLLSDLRANVNVSKFAQQRSQHEAVTKLAESIVKANGEMIEKVEKHVAMKIGERAAGAEKERGPAGEAVRERIQERRHEREGEEGEHGQHAPFATFKQQLSQRFSQTMISELEKKQGAEFDRAYVGGEIFALLGMRDTCAVAQQHAEGDFADALKECSQHIEQQLKQARQVKDQLEGPRGGTAGRERPTQRE